MKSRARTSLSITMLPEGGAKYFQKWSDLDLQYGNRPIQAAERIIAELSKFRDYHWLIPLVDPYLNQKYCDKCQLNAMDDEGCCYVPTAQKPFPYCFSEKK